MNNRLRSILALFLLLLVLPAAAAKDAKPKKEAEKPKEKTRLEEGTFKGLAFRSIGPAMISGRITDVAIHPSAPATWYVTAASGNVWKTTNAGTTWTPIF